MKIVKVKIGDCEYPLCFGLRAMTIMADKYGSVEAAADALGSNDTMRVLTACVDWLNALMVNGCNYVRNVLREDAPSPLAVDALLDSLDVDALGEIRPYILAAISGGQEVEIEIESKNQ